MGSSASSTRTVVIHWWLSKMTTLHSLAGKWKQIDSKGDSDVLKAVGIGKTKRRIIKRIKQRFEIQVKSDTEYTFIHKLFNRRDDVTLGTPIIRDTELGKGSVLVKFTDGQLVAVYEVIEPGSSTFGPKLNKGAKMQNTIQVLAPNKLQMTACFLDTGATMTKTFKRKGTDDNDDEDDAENAQLKNEFLSATNED